MGCIQKEVKMRHHILSVFLLLLSIAALVGISDTLNGIQGPFSLTGSTVADHCHNKAVELQKHVSREIADPNKDEVLSLSDGQALNKCSRSTETAKIQNLKKSSGNGQDITEHVKAVFENGDMEFMESKYQIDSTEGRGIKANEQIKEAYICADGRAFFGGEQCP